MQGLGVKHRACLDPNYVSEVFGLSLIHRLPESRHRVIYRTCTTMSQEHCDVMQEMLKINPSAKQQALSILTYESYFTTLLISFSIYY
jgi:hypothetical protein